ncbi:hypothetical protein A3K73_04455 [Candidatus Pacearchaeota archaeon RBG_13_36_9]|nr:MAG: hypothetical protein A3K73_04455 [Candidatus Pacearchaeota archaeon RBG_13_36_9]
MKEENKKTIEEVLDEIESVKDPKGIFSHQRRIAFLLSMGAVALLEDYLERLNVLKKGFKINHLWFKKKKENVKKLLSVILTCPIENLTGIDRLLDIIYELEKEGNELAYGEFVSEEKLREKINLFLELKKEALK